MEVISGLEVLVHGFDFATAVRCFYRGAVSGDDELRQAALRWIRGEFATKTEARAYLPVSGIIEDSSWYDYLKLVGARCWSRRGTRVLSCLSTKPSTYIKSRSPSRARRITKAFEYFQRLHAGQARTWRSSSARRRSAWRTAGAGYIATRRCVRAPGRQPVCAGGHPRHGGASHQAPAADARGDPGAFKAHPFIHAKHYDWDPGVTDEQIVTLVQNLAGRMGADVLLTPREVVRDFTGLLNILRQEPGGVL